MGVLPGLVCVMVVVKVSGIIDFVIVGASINIYQFVAKPLITEFMTSYWKKSLLKVFWLFANKYSHFIAALVTANNQKYVWSEISTNSKTINIKFWIAELVKIKI